MAEITHPAVSVSIEITASIDPDHADHVSCKFVWPLASPPEEIDAGAVSSWEPPPNSDAPPDTLNTSANPSQTFKKRFDFGPMDVTEDVAASVCNAHLVLQVSGQHLLQQDGGITRF